MYVFFLAPLLIVIVFSFNSASRITPPIEGFTWSWYERVIGNKTLLESVSNSVVVALSTGAATTMLTTLAGYALYQYPLRFRRVVEVASSLPLITPGLIYGVGLLIQFHGMGLKPSLFTIIVAQTLCPYLCGRSFNVASRRRSMRHLQSWWR
jgi:spermidine/putrescine transport system permease protein